MKKPTKRICVYPKDVQIITGKSYRYSRELLNEIRTQLGKTKNQYITIQEFGLFCGIDPLIIQQLLD